MNEQTAQIEKSIPIEQVKRGGSRLRYGLWAAGGFLFFAPFILVAAFCFARSSDRLNSWFKGTKVYKMVLEGYMTKRSMTLRAKLTILVPVTALLAVSFAMMSNVPVGRAIVAVVWVGHIVYFGFVVKTER